LYLARFGLCYILIGFTAGVSEDDGVENRRRITLHGCADTTGRLFLPVIYRQA
jgi:hypothetical protein